jgi:hypothetical protein
LQVRCCEGRTRCRWKMPWLRPLPQIRKVEHVKRPQPPNLDHSLVDPAGCAQPIDV